MPVLYVVATPIGNLEDITLRALRVLGEAGWIAAEDTRKTRVLLSRYGIKTPLIPYHEQGERSRVAGVLRRLAESDVALVSEAGMPGISDPGYELINAAIKAGHRVEVVPGPSAVATALVLSGLPIDHYVYLGFLPRSAGQRRRFLEELKGERRTLVAFESPHRLLGTLRDVSSVLGDRPIAVCRELTKVHEEVFRGTVREAIEHFQEPRGEFTLVLGGSPAPAQASPEEAARLLQGLRDKGVAGREAIQTAVLETGLPRRELYRIWHQMPEARTTSSSGGRRRTPARR